MFGVFKPKNLHRAGERSFRAFEAVWFGPPFSEFVRQHAAGWEQKYQETANKCKASDSIDVLNGVIDGTMLLVVNGNDKARLKAETSKDAVSESDAYAMSGSFIILGLLGQIIFSHAPAVAGTENQDPDRVCFDAVQCIKTSIQNRSDEMHPSYVDGANAILSSFLSTLFDRK
jgi:hypothetical protein